MEGEARGSKVVVRILREDATNEEKAYFLHEAKPYRDLAHKNVTRLFGRCLQYEPFLLLFELYTNVSLQQFRFVSFSISPSPPYNFGPTYLKGRFTEAI